MPAAEQLQRRTSELPEEAHDPTPDSRQNTFTLPVQLIVVLVAARLFGAATGFDLLDSPLSRPDDLSVIDPIVGLARELPIADRGPQTRAVCCLLQLPFRWSQRRAYFGAATTG